MCDLLRAVTHDDLVSRAIRTEVLQCQDRGHERIGRRPPTLRIGVGENQFFAGITSRNTLGFSMVLPSTSNFVLKTPPTRRSMVQAVTRCGFGPNLWTRCSGVVQQVQIAWRGAFSVRFETMSQPGSRCIGKAFCWLYRVSGVTSASSHIPPADPRPCPSRCRSPSLHAFCGSRPSGAARWRYRWCRPRARPTEAGSRS